MRNRNMEKFMMRIIIAVVLLVSLPANAAQQLYYIHSDHLNTPQVLTDSNQQVVWKVEQQTPFGEVEVDQDPDGDGEDVVFNLRFPGQYFDEETNTNYNYYRTYDPSLGRYIQSDPIGLAGGINTYGYGYQNPVLNIDPFGLFVPSDKTPAGIKATETLVKTAPRSGPKPAPPVPIGPNDPTSGNDTDCDDNDDPCEPLYQKINAETNGLARRYRQLRENKGKIDQDTHIDQFKERQRGLRNRLNEAITSGCHNYHKDAWYWASISPPVPLQ